MISPSTEETVVSAKASALSLLFYKGKYEVPWHQRYYDWDEEHVAELLDDLDEAFREERKCYFLGTVMLIEKSDGMWEINDGQQRMVTFSLICARLARTFVNEMDSRREGLALRILFNLNENHTSSLSEAENLTPRLSPPRNDKSNYTSLIRGKDIGTNGKFTMAWDVINKHFLSMNASKAEKFFDFIINKLEVACLFVPRELDPNSVFETLNARGKPLGALNLIRNHLYSFFSEKAEEPRRDTVHRNLEGLREQLRDDKKESNSLEYMRCYLQCKYGFLPEKSLYRETKEKIKTSCGDGYFSISTSSDYVFGLVEDISRKDRVQTFLAISSPDEENPLISRFIKDSGKSGSRRNLLAFLCELKNYKVTQPIIFSLLNRYVQEMDGRKKKNIARFVNIRLKLLTSFVMRTTFVVNKFEPSRFETAFSSLAKQITSTKCLDSIPFADILHRNDENDILDNSSFIEQMKQMTMTIRNSAKAKRFFLGLAYYEQSNSIVINERKYTIEHVLPKSGTYLTYWPNFDEREHSDNVFRIGNITLLSQADNRIEEAFNRSFSKKKEIYKNSAISLTRDIAKISDWSPEEIQQRQVRLAKLAAKVWDLPDVP